jgi:hypothetical protein
MELLNICQERCVDNVNRFGLGLGRTGAGLARIGDVLWSSQHLQGPECGSSPTSGTVFPQVRGRLGHEPGGQCPLTVWEIVWRVSISAYVVVFGRFWGRLLALLVGGGVGFLLLHCGAPVKRHDLMEIGESRCAGLLFVSLLIPVHGAAQGLLHDEWIPFFRQSPGGEAEFQGAISHRWHCEWPSAHCAPPRAG